MNFILLIILTYSNKIIFLLYLIAFCIMILLENKIIFKFPKLEDLLINKIYVEI